MLDQAEFLRELVREKNNQQSKVKKARVITVSSGKGGVGKSNFVVNTAISLQKAGKKVLILDADIGMGNDDVILGVYSKYSIHDVVLNNISMHKAIVIASEGVSLLSGGSALNRIEEITKEQREAFVEKLRKLDEFDYVLIDTGAGVSRTVLGFIAASDEMILVTTPEPTSITDAYSLVKALSHFKLRSSAKVVVNRCYTKEEGICTFEKFSNTANKFIGFDLSYLGFIYDDRALEKSVREQKAVVLAQQNAKSSKCIREISEKILKDYGEKSVKGTDGFFKKLFELFS